MMHVIFILYGLIQMILNACLWGIASYAVFMLLTKNDKRWQIGAWISAGLFFLWDEVVCSTVMNSVGLSMSAKSITYLTGPDMWNIDLFDVVNGIGLGYGGFVLGRVILKRVARGG